MLEFKAHASGSSGNFYTVTDANQTLAIECGLRFADLRRALGFRVSELVGCLVSHGHADHSKAVPDLLRRGIDCYMSAGTAEALKVSGAGVRIVKAHERFTVGDWAVLPFDAVHDAEEPLGFVIAAGDERLLYLTDSAYCKYRFAGLTVIAVECNYSLELLRASSMPEVVQNRIIKNHMSLETALELFRANDLSKVREIRLLHMSEGNMDAAAALQAVQEATGKPTFVARGGGIDGRAST